MTEQRHCDHECVCWMYRADSHTYENVCNHILCASDTRSRPVPTVARTPKEIECFGVAYDSTDEMCQMCRVSENCHIFRLEQVKE